MQLEQLASEYFICIYFHGSISFRCTPMLIQTIASFFGRSTMQWVFFLIFLCGGILYPTKQIALFHLPLTTGTFVRYLLFCVFLAILSNRHKTHRKLQILYSILPPNFIKSAKHSLGFLWQSRSKSLYRVLFGAAALVAFMVCLKIHCEGVDVKFKILVIL